MKKFVISTGTCAVLTEPENKARSVSVMQADRRLISPPTTVVDVTTTEEIHDGTGMLISVTFPLAAGAKDAKQDVMRLVLVVPAMVVTDVEVEVDTELPTDVENCVEVALP